MQITVKYFGLQTTSLPLTLFAQEGTTVKELLMMVTSKIQDSEEDLLKRATFLVNGSRSDLETELKDGDTLLILHVLGGG